MGNTIVVVRKRRRNADREVFMNINEFLKKFGSMVNEELTDKQIWDKAYNSGPSILSDPRVSTLKDEYGWTPLHELAKNKVKEVSKHPDVSKIKSRFGNTPLHYLANNGVKEILDHPDISKTKNRLDGDTPLHLLAWAGVKEAWSHPDFDKVKNKKDETPKDWWIRYGHKPLTCTDFIKK